MKIIVTVFAIGFVIGQAWAVLAYRDAVIIGGGVVTIRLIVVAAIETVVASLAFAVPLVRASKVQGVEASGASVVMALLSGVIANALTVGTYALVPVVISGDAQLLLYVVAVAVVSAILGYLQAAVTGPRRQNDG